MPSTSGLLTVMSMFYFSISDSMTVIFAPQGPCRASGCSDLHGERLRERGLTSRNLGPCYLDKRVVQTSERNYRPFDLRSLGFGEPPIVSQRSA